MNEKIKAFKEYVKSIFEIERVTLYIFISLRSICEELDASPSKKELNRDDLDARLTEVLGHKIDSRRLGIKDVGGAVLPHGKTKRRLFRKVLVSDGFVFSYDLLSEQFGKHVSSLLKKEEGELEEKGVEIPPHIKSFLHYLGKEGDVALQKEFLSRLEICKSIRDVSRMCDEMKKHISLNELKCQLDDLSAMSAASEAKLSNISAGVDWLVFDSLLN